MNMESHEKTGQNQDGHQFRTYPTRPQLDMTGPMDQYNRKNGCHKEIIYSGNWRHLKVLRNR